MSIWKIPPSSIREESAPGPSATIAVAQSAIVADQIGLKLFDYHVTESGFGCDLGFEKFWNIKCRASGLKPNVAVITTTVRGLKSHGVNAGALPCPPGRPLPQEYFTCTPQTMAWLEDGIKNMIHNINIVKKAGIKPVICINRFHTDTDEEIVRIATEEEVSMIVMGSHGRGFSRESSGGKCPNGSSKTVKSRFW